MHGRGAIGLIGAVLAGAAGGATPDLAGWWRSVSNPAPRFGTRDFYAFALEAVAAGAPVEWTERALELGASKQDRHRESRTYGNFAWYWEDPAPVDRNCVQFSMQRASLIWMHFRDRLTPRAVEILRATLDHAVEGVRRHAVAPSYSNIYLKKAWNCLALGERLGRADLAAEGTEMLGRWLRHTWSNGVSEYLSPTYYAVDFENLGLIARHSTSEVARARARAGMEFLWLESAAHWVAAAGRLGGPHSRDYDYLRGLGGLNRWAGRAGWPSFEDPRPSRTPWFDEACWVPPSAAASALVYRVPRMVRGRWSAHPGHTIAQWIGRRIAIGTAGAAYPDSMDKVFVVQFPGFDRVTASFLMDARGDPYGVRREPAPGGHSKAFHVYPFVASVQRGPAALLLASAQAGTRAFRLSGTNLTSWFSHWVLPADLPLYLGADGGPAVVKESLRLPEPTTAVFLRDGDVAAGFRFIWGTAAADGGEVEIVEDGRRYGARRFTWVHSRSPPVGRHSVAVFAHVADGLDDDSFARFRRQFSSRPVKAETTGDMVLVQVGSGNDVLRIRADLSKEERRELVGAEPWAASALLAIDGVELGAPVLERALHVAEP